MGLLTYIVLLALVGLVVGALGRLALPGKDPMTLVQTILVGLGGAAFWGLAGLVLYNDPTGAHLVLASVGAAAIVYFVRRSRGGGLLNPGTPPGGRGKAPPDG